jgi:hypothetical protein
VKPGDAGWIEDAGNAIHDHIVKEARQLAISLGWAATVGAVTPEMLCKALGVMSEQNRQAHSKKWLKIKSTAKGLDCAGSRHNNEGTEAHHDRECESRAAPRAVP